MRKAISFVLVLALVLGSFSMAFAADTKSGTLSDITGNANEDAIQVAYDLGIVTGNPDGTFLPDKAVNRAEFAAMITRALAIPDSALAGYTTTSFKDTSGYTWAVPYLAFCQSKGIMLGDGQGNAMPGRTISVNEAMTMALRAIGYTANSAELVGVWPANYVTVAQREDLYDNVAKETTVNKASSAQIVYNLLTVQLVAVNSDGETVAQWKDSKNKQDPKNLLNTNHNCTEYTNVILGSDYDYDDAIINISGKLGTYGTAYVNKDDELVAFKAKDSTALTGKMTDDGKFKVGDVKYDLGENKHTTPVAFANSDVKSITDAALSGAAIKDFAKYADGGKTVTINANVSGKKIKEIYSIVAWAADEVDLADSNVQEDIADKELLGYDFVDDDDKNIDYTSFQLVGVASLDKIAEDDVVYVYVNKDKDIRKVAVGTETVEGAIDEIEMDSNDEFASTITIGGKDYDVAARATDDAKKVDVDSEGIFYLDYKGEIYDFDGTSGKADTYGIVKTTEAGGLTENDNSLDRRVRIYTSDDSTKTLNVDSDKDLDWVKGSLTKTQAYAQIKTGKLVGYSLNSAGEIDTFDVTAHESDNVDFQSTKVLKLDNKTYNIDSDAVVFTYKGSTATTNDYDVVKLSEVNKGKIADATHKASVLLDGKDVVALFIEEEYTDSVDDDVYGVINTRVNAKNSSGDEVYRFKGFIDGSEFSLLSDGKGSKVNGAYAGKFGVYAITKDSAGDITEIKDINTAFKREVTTGTKSDGESGLINVSQKAEIITDINSSKTVVTTGSEAAGNLEKYTIADDAKVYLYDKNDKEFETAKLSALRKGYTVSLYDTKGDDADGVATVVIFIED